MSRTILFVLLLLFWNLLTWTGDLPGLESLPDFTVGLVVASIVTWTVAESSGERTACWLELPRYGWAVVYLFVLAAYIVKANLEVAYRVLHPWMLIRPGIVRVRTSLKSPAARTMLANSITLCPGTLALDVRDDGTFFVHWINVRSQDEKVAAGAILGRFEWFLERIFD